MICSFKNNRLSGYSFMKSCKIIICLTVLLLFFLFSGSIHAADGLIKNITFHGKNENSESVLFHLNGPWLPKTFALNGDNPRVVFDFADTRLAKTVPSSINTKGSIIRKIRTGIHSNKTRVVMDLAAGGKCNFDQQFDETTNILTIQLYPINSPEKQDKKPVVAAVAEKNSIETVAEEEKVDQEVVIAAVTVAEKQKKEVVETIETVEAVETIEKVEKVQLPESSKEETGPAPDPLLSDVSFENTSNKGEMVLFKLNGFYPPAVSGKEDGTPLIICDFSGTRLGEKVVKKQLCHGKFIERITVQQLEESDVIRVTLELVPKNNYDLQQVFFKEDDLFVIIVNPYNATDNPEE